RRIKRRWWHQGKGNSCWTNSFMKLAKARGLEISRGKNIQTLFPPLGIGNRVREKAASSRNRGTGSNWPEATAGGSDGQGFIFFSNRASRTTSCLVANAFTIASAYDSGSAKLSVNDQ